MSKVSLIFHFREKCIGCGACSLVAPSHWVMDEVDGLANLRGGKPEGEAFRARVFREDRDPHRAAAEACPVKIIQLS